MHRTDDRTRIFGHSAQHIPVRVFIMKEDLDLIIEEKWRKRDEFATFIAAIDKLIGPKDRNIVLYQGNGFINVYKTLFLKHYVLWLKELL